MSTAARRSASVDFVEQYAAAASRFAAAVAESDLHAPVAGCPGWSAYDLVVHLGNVHAWAATIVETGRRAAEQNDRPRSARARVVSRWYAGKAEDLHQVLRDASPEEPCWNFAFGAGETSFWMRRQAHETTVHQVDLDRARGRPTDLHPDLCADGVDEVLTVFLHRMHTRGHPARLDGPIAVTASDTGDTWVVAPQESGPPSVRATSPGAVDVPDRVEAAAEVLYLALWKRRPVDATEGTALRTAGDPARVRAFLGSRLVP